MLSKPVTFVLNRAFLFFEHQTNYSNDFLGFEKEKQKKKKKERDKTFLSCLKLVTSKVGTSLGLFLKEDPYQYLFSQVMFLSHGLGIFYEYSSSEIF